MKFKKLRKKLIKKQLKGNNEMDSFIKQFKPIALEYLSSAFAEKGEQIEVKDWFREDLCHCKGCKVKLETESDITKNDIIASFNLKATEIDGEKYVGIAGLTDYLQGIAISWPHLFDSEFALETVSMLQGLKTKIEEVPDSELVTEGMLRAWKATLGPDVQRKNVGEV
jgi:hypothetical protein